MKTIEITDVGTTSILEQINTHIAGNIERIDGEDVLEFNNNIGFGFIRHRTFDWGIALLDYNVHFNADVKITFNTTKRKPPIEFLFISKGSLVFKNSNNSEYVRLERFQNIIVSNDAHSKSVYVFPSNMTVQLNSIHVFSKKFMKKKNDQIDGLASSLLSVFQGKSDNLPFQHLGNFNLTIANKIKMLNEFEGAGIIRSLTIEGQLNLILALQMLEHKRYETDVRLSDSLSIEDIKKIHNLVAYIYDHVSQPMTIKTLSKECGLGPKKLQLGFRLLFSKSINEYIRNVKLEIARDMIKNTDKSISEIVYEIGYKSRSYFSKIFYEQYMILPIDYKESLRSNNIKN